MKKILIAVSVVLAFAVLNADAQKKRTKSKKRTVRTRTTVQVKATDTVNQNLLLCYTAYGMPSWYLAINKDFTFPVDMQQPSDYRLLTTNDTMLNSYLKTVPYDIYSKKVNLPIYSNKVISCKEFMITRVVTMDSALQAKYPQLMSFKAVDDANHLNTARIDCDGNTTRIMINHEGETYFITPVLFNKKMYYACYSKNDPNLIKQSFEQ